MEAVLIQSPHLRWVGRLKNYSIYSAGIIREVVTEKYRTVTNYLHGNQSKCICYRAKQDNCCKYRAEVFDHKLKIFFLRKVPPSATTSSSIFSTPTFLEIKRQVASAAIGIITDW